MARAVAIKNYFQFNKGLITEATGLSYPENSMKAAVNIDLNFDGSIKRRRGLQYEVDYSLNNIGTTAPENVIIQTFLWENAGANRNLDILVVRIADQLRFFDASAGAVSASFMDSMSLPSLVINERISFEKGNGFLFMGCSSMSTRVVEYDGTSFSYEDIEPQIRDEEGFDLGFENSFRPAIGDLTPEYYYNLANQGWPLKYVDNWNSNLGLAWEWFNTAVGDYPAMSDRYTVSGAQYNPKLDRNNDALSTDPVKGRFIVDAFNIDRGDVMSSVASIAPESLAFANSISSSYPADTISERPTAVGFFQGHALMGTVSNKKYASQIFVSQSIKKIGDIKKCYAVNDPTADIESSPLDTDGGIITIAGLGFVHAFKNLGPWCNIFSDTGVWSMRGADDGVFSINNAIVTKVSDVGSVSIDSIVSVDNTILYWTQQGIYAVVPDDTSLNITVQNITETSIQDLYNNISGIQRENTFGVLDKVNRKVYWLYNTDLLASTGAVSFYNRALVYDIRLNAFYEHEYQDVSTSSTRLSCPFFKRDIVNFVEEVGIIAGTDEVIAGTDEVVVEIQSSVTYETPSIMFVTMPVNEGGNDMITFSLYNNRGFKDWPSAENVSYSSYIETGYEILEQPGNTKQASCIHCFFNRTEESFIDRGTGVEFDYPSSCVLTSKWEWTTTGTANRWSDPQQVYRFRAPFIAGASLDPFDYDYSVITTRSKVRGKGKAVSFRFESEAGKDFQLLGWAIEYTAGAKI
jgi:hypothetical protein